MGDSRAARDVNPATADRSGTVRANAGMHAHRQTQAPTQTPAQTSKMCGRDSVTDRPTGGSACTPSVHATTFTPEQNKASTRFAGTGDAPGAREVGSATADRGKTASAHAGMHAHRQTDADAGAEVQHAWCLLREGQTQRRHRTRALRATTFTKRKTNVNTIRRDLGTNSPFAVLS